MNNKDLIREQHLMDALKLSEKLTINEVKDLLNISESTIRRLFIKLEKEGKVIRTIGGVQAISENEKSYHFDRLETKNIGAKTKIGKCASKLVDNNDIIFLDSGTTVARMCVELAKRIKLGDLKANQLMIFTTSLVNLNILQDCVTVNLIGGEYRSYRKDFCGYIAEETIKLLRFGKCFLGTDGFNVINGFSTTDFNTTAIAKLVIERSDIRYMVTDFSKYNKYSMVSYCNMVDIDYLIIDKVDDILKENCDNNNIEIVL